MTMANKIFVQSNEIDIISREQEDYISLTDMANIAILRNSNLQHSGNCWSASRNTRIILEDSILQ
jgi:hypothetical protein